MNTVKIDWLTLTKKTPHRQDAPVTSRGSALIFAQNAWRELGITGGDLVQMPNKARYPFVWLHNESQTIMHVSEEPWRQGLMFVASGKATESTGRTYEYLKGAVEHDWNCTRIDVAIDILDVNVTVQDVFFAHRTENPDERKKRTFTQSPTGDTFNLGSRQSNKYLRIYDKAAEQGVSGYWLRVELEYKGDAARAVLPLARKGAHNLVHDVVSFLGPCLSSLTDAMYKLNGEQLHKITVAKKTNTNRERWIRDTVFPAWVAWAHEQPGDAWQALYELLNLCSEIVTQKTYTD